MWSTPLVPGTSLRRLVALCLAVLWFTTVAAPPSSAKDDARAERERVRRRRAEVTASVDALKASDEQVTKALDDLAGRVRAQESRVANARQAADTAAQQADEAGRKQQKAERDMAKVKQHVRDFAVKAYVNPSTSEYEALLSSKTVNELARKHALLEAVTTRGQEVLDDLRAAREDLSAQREAAERAATQAQARRKAVDAELQTATAERDRQAAFAASVEARLDATLAEAASLAAIDANLSADIARREAAVAARVKATAPVARPGAPRAAPRAVPGSVRGGIRLATVRGITVAAEIADNVERLLAAAEGDGLVLGGSGYRDPADQVALRRAHCGTSDYAVYEMPASECSPPTAKPGSSMHEKGLAIDFTHDGRVITSRGSPAFKWLSGNAGRYGLYNLPSEPWHWSTNGN